VNRRSKRTLTGTRQRNVDHREYGLNVHSAPSPTDGDPLEVVANFDVTTLDAGMSSIADSDIEDDLSILV